MADDLLFEDFAPNPFDRPNPFRVLGAYPGQDAATISGLAAEGQLWASEPREQQRLRDALRELTADPVRRATWEIFTPHGTTSTHSSARPNGVGAALGRLLVGDDPIDPTLDGSLAHFASFLGWDRRSEWLGRDPDDATVLAWWQRATHRQTQRWEYWHHLALIYHQQAAWAERAAAEHESSCGAGTPWGSAPARHLDAYWLRAHRCWGRVITEETIWDSIRRHVEPLPGYRLESVERLAAELPRFLARLLTQQAERAIRNRNRLAAARRCRYLSHLVQTSHPDLAPLRDATVDALDRLHQRLWQALRQMEDPLERFDEAVSGLLLVHPNDLGTVRIALEAMMETGNREKARNGAFAESLRMAANMDHYVSVFCRQVFPRFPSAKPVNPDATRTEKALLHWYYLLRLQDDSPSPGPDPHQGLGYMEAIEEAIDAP